MPANGTVTTKFGPSIYIRDQLIEGLLSGTYIFRRTRWEQQYKRHIWQHLLDRKRINLDRCSTELPNYHWFRQWPSNPCLFRYTTKEPRISTHDWVTRHYNDVIVSVMASQITSLTIVYLTVYSGTDQRQHQSPASLAFVRGIHRWPVNSPHKGPVTRKMFPFDDVIMGKASRITSWWRNEWIHLPHS